MKLTRDGKKLTFRKTAEVTAEDAEMSWLQGYCVTTAVAIRSLRWMQTPGFVGRQVFMEFYSSNLIDLALMDY